MTAAGHILDVPDVLGAHRSAARLTRYDVDALDVLAAVVTDAATAADDHDLDEAAARLGVLLSLLPHSHPLAVAAGSGLDIARLRREWARDHVDTSHAVCAALRADRAARRRHLSVLVPPAIEYPPPARTPAPPASPSPAPTARRSA